MLITSKALIHLHSIRINFLFLQPMIYSNKLFIFLFTLLVSLSINLKGNNTDANRIDDNRSIVKSGTGIQNSNDGQTIASIQGVLQTLLKINEKDYPTFENLKDTKKNLYFNSHLSSFQFSTGYFTSYCLNRINRSKVRHFYIAYRRLII